jgi:hypothetical protein
MITSKSPSFKVLEDGTIIITVHTLFPATNGPEGLLRMGPTKYASKRQWWTKVFRDMGVPKAPMPCIAITARFYAKQPLDADSAVSASKLPMDALVNAEVLNDDSLFHVVDNRAKQYKVPTVRDQKTIIVLRPVREGDDVQTSPWPYDAATLASAVVLSGSSATEEQE